MSDRQAEYRARRQANLPSISTNVSPDFPVVLVSFGTKRFTLNSARQLHITDEVDGSDLVINSSASFSGTYKHGGGELTIEYTTASVVDKFTVHYTGLRVVAVYNGLEGTNVSVSNEGRGTIHATSSKGATLVTHYDADGDELIEGPTGHIIINKQGGTIIACGQSVELRLPCG